MPMWLYFFHEMISSYKAIVRAFVEMTLIQGGKESRFLSIPELHKDHAISNRLQALGATAKTFATGKRKNIFRTLVIDGKHEVGSFNREKNKFVLDVEKLSSLAKPAGFGKGSETVYDSFVRNGLEIAANRIYVKTNSDVVDELQTFAPFGKKLVPKLYKMHIYEQGGHFQKHADTLHGPNHYATLLIPVPTEYEGGKLVLEANGRENIIDLKETDYVAFLTDLKHQVLPVKTGHRVVLQYDLYLVPEDQTEDRRAQNDLPYSWMSYYEKKPKPEILKMPETTTENLPKLVDDFVREHPWDHVVFLLTHSYPMDLSTDTLKGSDLELYDMLKDTYHLDLGYVMNSLH